MREGDDRRSQRRYGFPVGAPASIRFGYPEPDDWTCEMPLRDLSGSGLSFDLVHELPGLEVGKGISRATVLVGHHRIEGDMVVMHLSPDPAPGSVCGALFFPSSDRDLRTLRAVLAWLEDAYNRQDSSAVS